MEWRVGWLRWSGCNTRPQLRGNPYNRVRTTRNGSRQLKNLPILVTKSVIFAKFQLHKKKDNELNTRVPKTTYECVTQNLIKQNTEIHSTPVGTEFSPVWISPSQKSDKESASVVLPPCTSIYSLSSMKFQITNAFKNSKRWKCNKL